MKARLVPENRNLVRLLNERHVLQQVLNNGPLSRSDVAKRLALNKVTVSDIVAQQLEDGFILETGQGDSSHNGGRRPIYLTFNAELGVVISFDMGYDYLDYLVTLMDGKPLVMKRQYCQFVPIATRVQMMISLCQQLVGHRRLLGVAVAIHGIVHDGKVLYAPYLDYSGVDVVTTMQQALQVPVVIENEANLSAIYERDFEVADEVDNIVCISIHKGIGAGIVINDQLYTGKNGEAGEIGHTAVYDQEFIAQRPLHTIEHLFSEEAVLGRLRKALGDGGLVWQEALVRYRQHDPIVTAELSKFCFYMAHMIYNMIITFAPQRVALNSRLMAEAPELLAAVLKRMPHLTDDETVVCVVNDVPRCTLLGASSVIIHQLLNMDNTQLYFSESSQKQIG